jgi:hypothetical protein
LIQQPQDGFEVYKMTYQEDPNLNRRMDYERRADRTTGGSTMGWVLGGLAALAIAAVLMFAFNNNNGDQTASDNPNRPAATQPSSPAANPPSTTGSGATTPAPANR